MKRILVGTTSAIILLAMFRLGLAPGLSAQEQPSLPRYIVVTLPTLGGTNGTAQQMHSSDVISGDANLNGDMTEHATFWHDGVIFKGSRLS